MIVAPNLELARFIGTYHAYRVAGTIDQYWHWVYSLTPEEYSYLVLYESMGVELFTICDDIPSEMLDPKQGAKGS